jgi:hypothetical protein
MCLAYQKFRIMKRLLMLQFLTAIFVVDVLDLVKNILFDTYHRIIGESQKFIALCNY